MASEAIRADSADHTFPSPDTVECPYPFYSWMRHEEPVYQLPGQNVFFVSRWEDIVQIVDDPEHFSYGRSAEASLGSRAGAGCPVDHESSTLSNQGLSLCDGAEHKLKRSLALKLVAPDRLRRYTEFIERTADELIDEFIDHGAMEFVSDFSNPFPVRVVCEILGVPPQEEIFAGVMAQAPSSAVRFLTAPEREQRDQVGQEIYEYMRRLVLERHADPHDDFLTELVHEHAQRAGTLPLEYLVGESITLLFGGLVTTQHMLTNTMFLLIEHPAELQRVLEQPSLVRSMLDESLRVESPFHLTEIVCTADTEIAGVQIPAGAAVYKVWGSGNRDEQRFEDPDDFRIGRPGIAKNHLGFGRGAHRCLGAPLALLEGTIAFRALLSRCRNIRYAPGRNDWSHVDVLSFRSLNQLHLEFDRV